VVCASALSDCGLSVSADEFDDDEYEERREQRFLRAAYGWVAPEPSLSTRRYVTKERHSPALVR